MLITITGLLSHKKKVTERRLRTIKAEHYVGIDYARMICSFLVVCIHFNGFNNILDRVFLLKSMAVPIFMFVSFFLTANVYMDLNVIRLKKRMIRLYVPVCIWGGGIFYY